MTPTPDSYVEAPTGNVTIFGNQAFMESARLNEVIILRP